MLNNFDIFRFEPGKTKIHLVPSFIKLLWIILFIIMNIVCNDLKIIIVLSLMSILITEMAYIKRTIYLKTIWSLKYLFIFLILIYFFIEKDFMLGLINCLKLFNIVLITSVLTITTAPLSLMEGIKKFLSPFKIFGISINRIAFSIYLAIRFIPTIMDVGSKIMKSQASRGVDYKTSNFKGKILVLKTMLVPIFILTMRKADNLADALEVRLYDIDSDRTYIKEEKTESDVQQTTQNTFGDFSYNNEPEQKEEISPLTQNDITFDSMDDVYQDEYEDEDNGDFQDNLGFDIF